MTDHGALQAAYATARDQLLAERNARGHWEGELASSPLATATAVSALVLAHGEPHHHAPGDSGLAIQCDLTNPVIDSLHWLAAEQNQDGGWGDTDRSLSNISTTMLVRAAFQLTGVPARYAGLVDRADQYIRKHGGAAAVRRRYGRDKTFAAPILTNCALAGLVPWRQVAPLPFELACLPQSWYHRVRLPVVSYAIPALVAIGQAKFHHDPPHNPMTRAIRRATLERSREVLSRMQPASGGYLEAVPLTSFVVMSLAGIGESGHPVVARGVEFLLDSVRDDGSWPIDTNLATWNTTQAIDALAAGNCEDWRDVRTLEWLLGCQHRTHHPFTGAAPGGWAWTDRTGGVPDADDTSGAILALLKWPRRRVQTAVDAGVDWLLGLQNRDGGWPTFCRGWGTLPFDRSATDITAHALRALRRWQTDDAGESSHRSQRVQQAIGRGVRFLENLQRADGSWIPLWFGNQYHPRDENPVYGTARVLRMAHELRLHDRSMVQQAVAWLVDVQLADGGWGPADAGAGAPKKPALEQNPASVEETALATLALLPWSNDRKVRRAVERGVAWLVSAVEGGHLNEPAPIGFYFAKLWYHERLYPLIFATAALGRVAASSPVCAAETLGLPTEATY